MAHLSFIFVSSNWFIMKYKEKEKQKAVKVKGQNGAWLSNQCAKRNTQMKRLLR